MTLRMCAGSKTFCPIENFATVGARTCSAHLSWPIPADGNKGSGRKRTRPGPAPTKNDEPGARAFQLLPLATSIP